MSDRKKGKGHVPDDARGEADAEAVRSAITAYARFIDGIATDRSASRETSREKAYPPGDQGGETLGAGSWQVLQEFIDAIPAFVLLVDDTHHIVTANRTVQEHLHLAPNELRGGYCPQVVHSLNQPFPGCPLEKAVAMGHWVESDLHDPVSGLWLASAIYPTNWRTKKGSRIFIHMVTDITARKNAEERLQKALGATIDVLVAVTAVRDPYTADHARRVAELARAIALAMGLPADQVEGVYVAGCLHDIGKLYVPAELLNKPRRLTDLEMNLVKMHPQVANDILQNVSFPWPVATIVLQHHERVDGSGYPFGLKSEAILPEARILAVADVVEAMSSHRPYRPALGTEAALAEIAQKRGVLYDAAVVDACLQVFAAGFEFH